MFVAFMFHIFISYHNKLNKNKKNVRTNPSQYNLIALTINDKPQKINR